MRRSIECQRWGQTTAGQEILRFTMVNRHGLMARVSSLGAALTELWVPDRRGGLQDIVLGFDDCAGYLVNRPYFGVTVGRVANRIARGQFDLGGTTYMLECNDGRNALHGGSHGFHSVVWQAEPCRDDHGVGVRMFYHSADGEGGYPGNLSVSVTYRLMDSNELKIEYSACSDRQTPVNLTNHSYFNLSGQDDILAHQLVLASDCYLSVDVENIPTGAMNPVDGTALDFRQWGVIGAGLRGLTNDPVGYDHTFVLRPECRDGAVAAEVFDPESGRLLRVVTTEPGVQLYTANFLDGSSVGKQGRAYRQYAGLCLETQHYPDAVHHSHFPSIILEPGVTRYSTTRFCFAVASGEGLVW